MKILKYLLLVIPTICPATSATAATFEIKPQIFNGTGADSFCDALRQEIRTSALAAAKAEAKTLTETQIKALQNSACTYTNRIVQRKGRYDINYHIAAVRVPTSRKNESNLYVFITSSQGFSTSGFPPKVTAEPGETRGTYYGAYNLMSAFTKTYVGPYASTLSYIKAPPQDSSVTTSSAAMASVGGSVNVKGNGLNAQLDIGYSHSTTRISSNGDYDRTQNFFESIDNKRYLVTRLIPSIGAPLLGAVSSAIKTGKGAGAVSKVLTGNWTPDLSTIYVIEGIDEKINNNFPVVIRTGAQLMQAEKYKRCVPVTSPFGGAGAISWSCDTSTYRELYSNKVEDVTELSITTSPDTDSGLVLNIE